jgi:hypothetical protein
MHRLFSLIIWMLFPVLVLAVETCPDISTISRTPGEYAWQSTDGRWEGYFLLPRVGRGSSTQVVGFEEARWIQLTNLLNSSGVVECDYIGNNAGEIIRFVNNASTAMAKPTSNHWSCEFNSEVPGTVCVCGGEASGCRL